MTISTFTFFFFVIAVFILYFIFPKKWRWIVLLASSLVFYAFSDIRYFLYIGITAVTVYFAALDQQKLNLVRDEKLKELADREQKKALRAEYKAKKRSHLGACIGLNLAILIVLKYTNLFVGEFEPPAFFANQAGTGLLMPLGISFYTFQAVGYLIDVYNGKVKAETNFAKFALFVSFFPQIIQGPISRFDQLAPQLYEGHSFDFDRMKSGLELTLWGYIKKLVIADLTFNFVWEIVCDYQDCSGTAIVFAMLLYSARGFADFSGGIDIMRGICQVLGIDLPVNFRQPYLSRSLSEFWRRWHITLGEWFKDYVFFPLATSRPYNALGRLLRKKFSRKTADRVCTSVVSLVTFVLIGMWHGNSFGYVIYGFWHGLIIAVSTMLTDVFPVIYKKLHIDPESWYWKTFQVVRTYILVVLGLYLVLPLNYMDGVEMLKMSVMGPFQELSSLRNVLTKYHFYREFPVVMYGIAVMVLSAIPAAMGIDLREKLNKMPFPIQWVILIAGIIYVCVFGAYGDAYDATSFIYQVF